MKNLFTVFLFVIIFTDSHYVFSQTETPAILVSKASTEDKSGEEENYRAGIYGIGSFGSQEIENFNTSARLSAFVKPYAAGLINLSFNKSATIADSNLSGALLFPEIGNSAFMFSWEVINFWPSAWEIADNQSFHSLTPFIDIALQNSSADINDTARTFSSINQSLGIRYTWRLNATTTNDEDASVAFRASLFVNRITIPEEDVSDFGVIVNDTSFSSSLGYIGARIDVSFNQFNIFATGRFNSNDDEVISVRGLQGFNFMIGTSINADVVRFKMKQDVKAEE